MSKRIALIGLDGSGKSANIDRMKIDTDYSQYQFVWVRWKPTLLKWAYILMEKRVSKKTKTLIDMFELEKRVEINRQN